MRKRIRRTICGRPVKGKISWLNSLGLHGDKVAYLVIFGLDEDCAHTLQFFTAQAGVDLDGNIVDASYRTVSSRVFETAAEFQVAVEHLTVAVHAAVQPGDPTGYFQELARALTARAQKALAAGGKWGVSASTLSQNCKQPL